MLKVHWSMSYCTVPHYNHIGTHTTYKHWSTSGNALGKWWVSSGMHPFSRGPYIFSLHATGIIGDAVRTGRRGVVGLGHWPSHFWTRIGLNNNSNNFLTFSTSFENVLLISTIFTRWFPYLLSTSLSYCSAYCTLCTLHMCTSLRFVATTGKAFSFQ